MDSKIVCVNCQNEKPVNGTDNRLVTESCGHVKCISCLLDEKSGCSACQNVNGSGVALQIEAISKTDDDDTNLTNGVEDKESMVDVGVKKKPETSHIQKETDAKGKIRYICTVCQKRFYARSHVMYHAYCNGQRKPYQCPDCSKSFASQSHFKYHMRVHRDERRYVCADCGERFFQMCKLQRHRVKHTNEKKHPCPTCSKAFTNALSLRRHSLLHSEERPLACAVCSRRFRDASNLAKHVANHDAQKEGQSVSRPHACARCPLAFRAHKDLLRHVQIHTDQKPFRCKVCSRRFRRKDNLERHVRKTHRDHDPASAVDLDPDDLIWPNNTIEEEEKLRLEKLNPLPPIPESIKEVTRIETDRDKSYIIEANTTRQSVIVGNVDRKPASPIPEYVHKIRKANSTKKDVPLPPIDTNKFIELDHKTTLNNLDVGTPLQKNMQIYKNILYGEKEESAEPELHWRRKMRLDINWLVYTNIIKKEERFDCLFV